MSLENDTIFTFPNDLEISSTSDNATSYTFLIDNVAHWERNQPVRLGFRVGLTELKLVAYNGTCSDTTVRYIFVSGEFPSDTTHTTMLYGFSRNNNLVRDLIEVKSGGYLLAGRRVGLWNTNQLTTPYLVKIKPSGCIDWSKTSEIIPLVDIFKVEETDDGSFFVAGLESGIYNTSTYFSSVLMRMSSAGDVIWIQRLGNGNEPGENNLVISGMKVMPGGGVVVTGTRNSKSYLVRLDRDGNIIWQRTYDYFNSLYGLDHVLFKDQFLYVGGLMVNTANQYTDGFIAKVDFSTGNLVWLKRYKNGNEHIRIRDMHDASSHILVNLTTSTGVIGLPMIAGYMKMDVDGAVQEASLIADITVSNSYTYSTQTTELVPSGNSFYFLSQNTTPLPLQPYISYGTILVKLDKDFNLDWAAADGGAGQGTYQHIAPAISSSIRIAGLETGSSISPNDVTNKIAIKRFDANGNEPMTSCSFGKKPVQKLPLTITVSDEQWSEYIASGLLSKVYNIPWINADPKVRYTCPDYVDSCSFLRLTGPASVCNFNNTYTYRVHKNKGCGQPTRWSIPSGINIITQTDSMLVVKFPSFGKYTVLIEAPFACNPLLDSIIVEVASITPPLNLGADTSICPGNSYIIHAGSYYSYKWSDSSIDSTLQANEPGEYWVEVTDECGNVFKDTVRISISSIIPLSLGADRIKCNNDTLHLHAPDDFLRYTWGPDYNISSLTGQNIVVNPVRDTIYFLQAEKRPGCFAYDTLRITVNLSPRIELGNDTSICKNDALELNAGSGFSTYSWNTGNATQQLLVGEAGKYSVIGTTSYGCQSFDTLIISKILPLPSPNLDKNIVLCERIPYELSAGAGYKQYLWNDGSTDEKKNIVSTGLYWVEVVDVNGCSGSDTTVVSLVKKPPSLFLPQDTVMCDYELLQIQSQDFFRSYKWSNASVTQTITVDKPGEYWLEVMDEDKCVGRDTIKVRLKDCMKGFFIPTAFTPNNDQLNDLFKPLLYGSVDEYRFMIFDRWGKLVFQSDVVGEGWDGMVNGKQQNNTGLYVWTCTFRMRGGRENEQRKGSVLLIR